MIRSAAEGGKPIRCDESDKLVLEIVGVKDCEIKFATSDVTYPSNHFQHENGLAIANIKAEPDTFNFSMNANHYQEEYVDHSQLNHEDDVINEGEIDEPSTSSATSQPEKVMIPCPVSNQKQHKEHNFVDANADPMDFHVEEEISGNGGNDMPPFVRQNYQHSFNRKRPIKFVENELNILRKEKVQLKTKLCIEQLKIAERQRYKLDLELMKMEQELDLPPSKFTKKFFENRTLFAHGSYVD